MKLNKDILDKISRKVNRDIELCSGRISYNRLHKDKRMYDRKKNKKIIAKCLAD
jgi:hypothetical protein